LRVRTLREDVAKRELGAKLAEIARLDEENRHVEVEIRARQVELQAAQAQGRPDALALAQGRAWIARLRQTIQQREREKHERLNELNNLRAAVQQARMHRRAIEKLRERRLEEHRRRVNRAEQVDADELARVLQASDARAARPV
jgi:flagellar export protein FliJ